MTEYSAATVPDGYLVACANFEPTTRGYERCKGYERFDGQALASSIPATKEDDTAREAQRALINPVPGSGEVLGVTVYQGHVYAFRNATDGLSCKMYKATPTGWQEIVTGVTLSPDGRFEFVTYNFYAGANSAKLYGVDGVNPAFEFDGSTFTQITTGLSDDKPSHIAAHQYHLFVSYKGSVLHSAPGNPLDWNVVNGAGELGVGDEVHQLRSVKGGALVILMRNRISLLYGTSSLDWKSEEVQTQDEKVGGKAFSVLDVGQNTLYLDDRGLTSLQATNAFGNFNSATVSLPVRTMLQELLPYFRSAYAVKEKNQYCAAFREPNDSLTTILIAVPVGETLQFGVLRYPFAMSCVTSSEDSGGVEVIYAGSSNGYVYKLESGTSFDGQDIFAFIGTSYMTTGSMTLRKRYKRALITVDAKDQVAFRVKPEFSFSSLDVASHRIDDVLADGGGGIWGVDNWAEFTWSSPVLMYGHFEVEGTAVSLSLAVNYTGKHDDSFTLNTCVIDYIVRRLER